MRELDLSAPWPGKLGEGLAVIPEGAAVQLSGRIESVHEGILVSGEASTVALAECSRCLTDFELDVQVDFTELFAYSLTEDFDYGVDDDHVDLEPVVRDAVVLALPFQPVCRPDCAGLNPESGEKLAPGQEWEPESSIDPRWAALEGFRKHDDA
ncbi:YceD family protein [Humidisolicoccus flavus]|uniref:YceD family protein n=1 Tax=Humidisolicoccus flavus TaxID=3111414 RepID=UPI00324BB5F7